MSGLLSVRQTSKVAIQHYPRREEGYEHGHSSRSVILFDVGR